jgi:peptide/nickel transport system ATP-binding protein
VAPAPPAAAVEGVSVVYGSARHRFEAVKAVTLSVPAARTVGLVGESGSGKTTLGLAIARLLPTAGGEIQVGGRDLSRLRSRELRAARADIGFVFQDPVASLNPRRRVGASIAQPLRVHAKLPAAEEAARVAELLTAVQLNPGFAARYPHELSGGERQRVAIARALALKPTLVIADEPTSALDVSVQARILDLLLRLQDEYGFGCLFISHNLAVVNRIAQFVVVMKAGEVVEQGPTAAILSDPEQPYTRELLAAQPRLLH